MVPPEIDVFTEHHSRMKQLIEAYLHQLADLDLSNKSNLDLLVSNVRNTFMEFKHHESIEHSHIVEKLQKRLKALEIQNDAVDHCHKDNKISEVLELVTGYKQGNTANEYGQQLQTMLEDFAVSFIPHMQEEEEVFQPLLMQYFEYDDLKTLKSIVLQQHISIKENMSTAAPEFPNKDEEVPVNILCIPEEVMINIYSYLNARDRAACAQACKFWNDVYYTPSLWNHVSPVEWIVGNRIVHVKKYLLKLEEWLSVTESDVGGELMEKEKICAGFCYKYYGGSFDDNGEWDDINDWEDYRETVVGKRTSKELPLLQSLARWAFPRIGMFIKTLCLSGSRGVRNFHVRIMLKNAPNLVELDLSYCPISDGAFQGLSSGHFSKLHNLILCGVCRLTDAGMIDIIDCAKSSKLTCLSLSGCTKLTDLTLQHLMFHGRELLSELLWLDLSGMYHISATILRIFIQSCIPKVKDEDLYYCINLNDGSLIFAGNGCGNLESRIRHCCCFDQLQQ